MNIANHHTTSVSTLKNAFRLYLKGQSIFYIAHISGKPPIQGVLRGSISNLPSSTLQ